MKIKAVVTGLLGVFLFPFVSTAANAWMQEARKTPAWFTEGVMYQIQPRAFTPEGTLKAAERKPPYLKDLGVTIVYLVPVMKMDTSTDRSFWSPRRDCSEAASGEERDADGSAELCSRPVRFCHC